MRVTTRVCDMATEPVLHTHQNISSLIIHWVFELREQLEFIRWGDNQETKEVRVISLAGDNPSGLVLPSYKV